MSDLIDLIEEKAKRNPTATIFTLTATDVGSRDGIGHFAWTWETWDNESQWKPSNKQLAAQLRRVARRMERTP